MKDFSATTNNPQVVFVILIANQFFIKQAELFESAARPAAVSNRVHIAVEVNVVKAGATDGEGGMIGCGDRALTIAVRLGPSRTADIVCTRLLERFEALQEIIWSIGGMRIRAHDDFTPRGANGSIESARCHLSGVINHLDPRIFSCQIPQNLSSPVGGHSVRDHHLKASRRRFQGEQPGNAICDMARLVAAGNNHRNLGTRRDGVLG